MDIKGLKDKILQLAIQGKLVEQDENDEPASELLKRIKEEREKLIKEKKIRKQKSLPEIIEEERPFEIPKNWELVRLGVVGEIIGGGTPKTAVKEYWEDGTIPWLTPADLSNYNMKYISKGRRCITPLGLKESSAQLLPKGTVLFSSRAPIGYTVISKNEISTNQGFKSCIPLIMDMNEYLYYYLIYSAKIINENASGTTFKEVSGAEVSNLMIPLPPLTEQKRIAKKIDQLFALIDTLDSNKEDLLEVINLTRNQVLQEAIQGKLVKQNPEDEPASILLEKIKKERVKLIKEKKIRKQKLLPEITEKEKLFEIPNLWEWVKLGEIAEIVGGGTPKTSVKEYWNNGTIPWLTPADLSNYTEKYISKGRRCITDLGLKKSSAQLMPKGTVLFSSRAPIGYTVIANNDISTNQGFKSCIPFIMDMNEYLYYYLIHSAKIINKNASGTTFKEVSGAEVRDLILPLPPLAEQKRIVEKVDTIMSMLDELERELISNL